MYAKVAMANEFGADRCFDYAVPAEFEGQLNIGMRVIVPFGRRNNMAEAFVIGLKNETDVPLNKIKAVSKVLDKEAVFSDGMLKLAYWMKERYFTPLGKILSAMLPSALKTKRKPLFIFAENGKARSFLCLRWIC